MILCSIAAMAQNRVIGKNNELPWHIPEDLKHFKQTTFGRLVIMGRKTYESLGAPLPKRRNIVLSRSHMILPAEVEQSSDIDGLLRELEQEQPKEEEVFIIGGAEIYKLTLSRIQRLYLTIIHQDFEGDTYFPEVDLENDFQIIDCRKSQDRGLEYSFITAERSIKE